MGPLNECWQQEEQHNLWRVDKPTFLPSPTAQIVQYGRSLQVLQLPRVILPELLLRSVYHNRHFRGKSTLKKLIRIETRLILILLCFLHSLIPIQEHVTHIYYKGQEMLKWTKKVYFTESMTERQKSNAFIAFILMYSLKSVTKCWSSASQLPICNTDLYFNEEASMNKENNCHNLSKYL